MSRADRNPIDLENGSRVEFHEIETRALNGPGSFSIFLPPSYGESKKVFPVVYFLHGMNNDHTSWTVTQQGDLPSVLDRMMHSKDLPELIFVHPIGDRSFYTNFKDGTMHYEDWVVEELPAHVEKAFRASTARTGRAIAGTSMGGYGALKIAMRFPERYAAVAAHSAIVMPVRNPFDVPDSLRNSRRYQYFSDLFSRIYGTPFDQAYYDENNPLRLAAEKNLNELAVYFDYGTADRYDPLVQLGLGLKTLSSTLDSKGISHTFNEYPGEPHGWALVMTHMEQSLGFLAEHLEP